LSGVTELPTEDLFREAIGDQIELRLSDEASVTIVVADVTSHGERDPAPEATVRRRPFSVTFRGPRDLNAPQRIYGLSHERLGEFELFLVPLGPNEDGMLLEAVFG
jgi:hypothetical protein